MSSAAIAPLSTPFTAALKLDISRVEAGVPLAALSQFVSSSGLPLKHVLEVVIPSRTLKHRRAKREPLSLEESDRFARLVRVFDHAVSVFDGPERARLWLEDPKRRFEGRTPLAMLRTDIGGRMVDEMLGQIEYGIFA